MRGTWGVAFVLAVVVVSSVGVTAQTDETDCPVEVDGTPDEPGEELADVVGAQQSVVARELERRGFNATLANASSPAERATVVATELDRIELRLSDLENCRDALVEAREDGDLSASKYRQRAAMLEEDVEDVSKSLNRAKMAATDLSPRVREQNDIGEKRFEKLEARVDDLETFVAEPDRAIQSANDAGSVGQKPAETGDSSTEEPPETERTTTETSDDGNGPPETGTESGNETRGGDGSKDGNENKNGDGPVDDKNESSSGESGPVTGTSYA